MGKGCISKEHMTCIESLIADVLEELQLLQSGVDRLSNSADMVSEDLEADIDASLADAVLLLVDVNESLGVVNEEIALGMKLLEAGVVDTDESTYEADGYTSLLVEV